MKAAEAKVGTRVLAGNRPTYSPKFRSGTGEPATVIETGVTHNYNTQGGFTSYGKYVTKSNGIRVRYDYPQRPYAADGDPVTEAVYRPEMLELLTPEMDARIAVVRERDAQLSRDAAEAEARQNAADQALSVRFADQGHTATFDARGARFSRADALDLIEIAERYAEMEPDRGDPDMEASARQYYKLQDEDETLREIRTLMRTMQMHRASGPESF